MRGIVWYYTDREVGLSQFLKVIKDYEKMGFHITQAAQGKFNTFACFDNGDVWSLAKAGDGAKGRACNVGLIERNTPEEIIHSIIMPCIKLLPYRAYNYYGG